MITLNSVSKELGRGRFQWRAIDELTWTIKPRSRIVILGQRIAVAQLLNIIAGLTLPTEGWVERRATTSVPNGFLPYGQAGTGRQLIHKLCPLFNVDERSVAEFIERLLGNRRVLDTPIRRLPLSVRQELNIALTYAIPCDFYLFFGGIGRGHRPAFQALCQEAFTLRCKTAGTIIGTNLTRTVSSLSDFATGAILYRGRLTLYKRLEDATMVYDSLPPEEDAPKPYTEGPEPEDEDIGAL